MLALRFYHSLREISFRSHNFLTFESKLTKIMFAPDVGRPAWGGNRGWGRDPCPGLYENDPNQTLTAASFPDFSCESRMSSDDSLCSLSL